MKVRGLLINVDGVRGSVEELEIEDDLEEYYRILNCTTIDITERMIGERCFTFVCDDEALLSNKNPSAASGDPYSGEQGQPMLFGNLFICNTEYDCELESLVCSSLSDDDMIYVLSRIFVGTSFTESGRYSVFPVVCFVDYVKVPEES